MTLEPIQQLYLNSIKGRPSAEVFLGIACLYSLLEKKLAEYFTPYDLTPVKFNALMIIKHLGGEGGLSQNEIGEYLLVTPSNITRLIDRLIVDRYVVRVPSEKDRRANIVKITPKGSHILNKVWHGFGEIAQQTVYLLEKSEVKELSALLLKWLVKLEEQR